MEKCLFPLDMCKEWGNFRNVCKKDLLFISICGSEDEFTCIYTSLEILTTVYN